MYDQKMFLNQLGNIRDILRTVGVTGADSIQHCIAFICLRKLTEKSCKSLGIPEEFAFENFKGELDDEELRNKFWQRDPKANCFITHLRVKIGFRSFKFKDDISNLHFRKIFDILENIDTDTLRSSCDIVGDIYELHLKTGAKSARDLGQFFTNRLVIKFMVALASPQLGENGQIETIVDPTMGTGGFLSMAVDYLNTQGKIDWKKNCKRIFGFDLDSSVRDYASVNLLLETGQKFPNLVTRDTLGTDICIDEKPISCDVILANEPMGIKSLKFANFCDRIKELKMPGTKAEPAFLQLFATALNKNGRCAVIIPDGVLFSTSKQHSSTRKYLVENFEVREIVKMNDKNFFMNTGVSASIVYFANTGSSTNTLKFSEISLNKDMTEIIYKEVQTVSYEDIKEKEYNFNLSLYCEEKKEIDGIEYKTLGELCKFLPKSKRLAGESDNDGKYDFFSSSNIMRKINVADYDFPAILIGTGGNANINYSELFSCSTDVLILQNNTDNSLKYIYYYLKSNLDILQAGFRGTGLKHITKQYVNNIKIPIPSLEKQREIIEKLDILSENNKDSEKLIQGLKKTFQIYMDLKTEKCEKVELRHVCDYKLGKFISRDCQPEGKYPFYNSKAIGLSGYSDKYCFDYPDYLIITKDGGAGQGKYGEQIGLGTVYKVNGKSGATSHQLALIPKQINIDFFYYVMKNLKNKIMDLAQYTTGLGTIKSSTLMNLKIPIPSLNIQSEIITKCEALFPLISNLENQIIESEAMIKDIISNLSEKEENEPEYASIVIEDDEEQNETE